MSDFLVKQVRTIEALIESGAMPGETNAAGATPLQLAVDAVFEQRAVRTTQCPNRPARKTNKYKTLPSALRGSSTFRRNTSNQLFSRIQTAPV